MPDKARDKLHVEATLHEGALIFNPDPFLQGLRLCDMINVCIVCFSPDSPGLGPAHAAISKLVRAASPDLQGVALLRDLAKCTGVSQDGMLFVRLRGIMVALAWHLRGVSLSFAWHLHGVSVALAWDEWGVCVALVWRYSGVCVAFPWC